MAYKDNIKIQGENGLPVNTDLYGNFNSKDKKPLIIFLHGFKGFKDWGGFPYMLQKISGRHFITAGFNFTYNGADTEHPAEFTRLDLFAKNTFTRELNDIGTVLDYFFNNAERHSIDKERIALIGHSRGGGIAIIKAHEDSRIRCLVTLASVSDFDRYSSEHKKKWKEKGYFEVLNTRTNQLMRLNSTLLEDIERNKERFNIKDAAKDLHKPFLIIHGKEDLSVRFNEAEELYSSADKKLTELFAVENTGHTFGVVHPFEGTTKAFEIVIEKITGFLKQNFRSV